MKTFVTSRLFAPETGTGAGDTLAKFTAQMKALDEMNTYHDMMAQNADLSVDGILGELGAMSGRPVPNEGVARPDWMPATKLARWARDQVVPNVASGRFVIEGDVLKGQLLLEDEAPKNLSELDIYVNGRLVAEVPITDEIRQARPALGAWIEAPLNGTLPDAAGDDPQTVHVELCQVNRVLAEAKIPSDPQKSPRSIEGGFVGVRNGLLTFWAVDRNNRERPVPTCVDIDGRGQTVLVTRAANFTKDDILAKAIPINALRDDADHAITLSNPANGRMLKRGQFMLRHAGDSFFVWTVQRRADGGLFGTVLAYKAKSAEPTQGVEVMVEVTPTEPGQPVLQSPEIKADQPDLPGFKFGSKGNSFGFDAPGLLDAGTPSLVFRSADGAICRTGPIDMAALAELPAPDTAS